MSWIMGAGLGFLLGGPLGAVVGGSMQHFISSAARKNFAAGSGRPVNDMAFFVTYLTPILTKIAMADGRVSQSELDCIKGFFIRHLGFGGMEIRYVEGLISETMKRNPDLGSIIRSFNERADKDTRMFLLDICYQVAAADGTISVQEQGALAFVAETLQLNSSEHERIRYKYAGFGGGAGARPSGSNVHAQHNDYALLGIKADATDGEVKKAYRQMAAQYHPDKVAHLGGEFQKLAEEKFKEINQAHARVKKSRGI